MRLRILHVFDHSLPLQSGYVSRSFGILRSQRARGWETVQVTAPRHAAWARREQDVENFGELSFHRTKPPTLRLPFVYPVLEMMGLRRRIAEVAARERPLVTRINTPILNVIPALSVAKRFGVCRSSTKCARSGKTLRSIWAARARAPRLRGRSTLGRCAASMPCFRCASRCAPSSWSAEFPLGNSPSSPMPSTSASWRRRRATNEMSGRSFGLEDRFVLSGSSAHLTG